MKKILLVLCLVLVPLALSACSSSFVGEWTIARDGKTVVTIPEIQIAPEFLAEADVEDSVVVIEEAVIEEVTISTTDHMTWSVYGEPSFMVNDGSVTETGSDLFTDPSKGSLFVTITPSEPVCLLWDGQENIYSAPFQASFEEGEIGEGFRVIAFSHWQNLPVSDGAFMDCWEREEDTGIVHPPLWEVSGQPSFFANDGNVTEVGGDLFTNPNEGALTLRITPSEEVCLLQGGRTQIFTNPFEASFEEGNTAAGFRVISFSQWEQLPRDDGAYNLCWPRE